MGAAQSIVTHSNSNTLWTDSHQVRATSLAGRIFNNLLEFKTPGQALRIIISAEQSVDYIMHCNIIERGFGVLGVADT